MHLQAGVHSIGYNYRPLLKKQALKCNACEKRGLTLSTADDDGSKKILDFQQMDFWSRGASKSQRYEY